MKPEASLKAAVRIAIAHCLKPLGCRCPWNFGQVAFAVTSPEEGVVKIQLHSHLAWM